MPGTSSLEKHVGKRLSDALVIISDLKEKDKRKKIFHYKKIKRDLRESYPFHVILATRAFKSLVICCQSSSLVMGVGKEQSKSLTPVLVLL